jgi:hypothetical protein
MIVDLLPLVLASMALPVWIIITLLLLRGPGGVAKAAGFAAGAILARSLVIFVFHFVFASAAGTESADSSGVIGSTLLTVVGILLLVAAYKKWRKEEDPDAPPPKWMAMLGGLSAPKAFGFGALLMLVAVKQWVFTLSAVAIVEEAQLTGIDAVLSFVFFVLGSMALVLLPVIFSAVLPKQATGVLEKVMGVLERYNRPITIGVSLIFGVWFLFKGVTGLMG